MSTSADAGTGLEKDSSTVPVLLISANVGSVFEDVSGAPLTATTQKSPRSFRALKMIKEEKLSLLSFVYLLLLATYQH